MTNRTPKLKEGVDSDFKSYTCYEYSPHQFIVQCDTFNGIMQAFDKVPDELFSNLKHTIYDIELPVHDFLQSIKPGKYTFDIIAYSSQQFLIVDILCDKNHKLDDFMYIDRLIHAQKLFTKPCKYFKVKSIKKFDVRNYSGFSNMLILKDDNSTLQYNTDFKFKRPSSVHKIVGSASVIYKCNVSLSKQRKVVADEYDGDDVDKIKQIYKSKVNDEKEKKVFLVADKNNVIFGYSLIDKNSNQISTQKTTKCDEYKWICNNNKYRQVEYFKNPCLGSFILKVSPKNDLSKLTLVRMIRSVNEEGGVDNSEVEDSPFSIDCMTDKKSKKNLSNTLVGAIKRLNYYIFDENIDDYFMYKRVLTNLVNHLNSQNGGGPISMKSIKRYNEKKSEGMIVEVDPADLDEDDEDEEEEEKDSDEESDNESNKKIHKKRKIEN